MARTSGEPGQRRAEPPCSLCRRPPTGVDLVRHVGTVDRSMLGGHCEMGFTRRIRAGRPRAGGVDEGFRYAQVRLGPARMTHVMRWTGAARRAHEVAVRHVAARRGIRGPTRRPGHDAAADRRQRDRPGRHAGPAATGLPRARRRWPGIAAPPPSPRPSPPRPCTGWRTERVQMCGGLGRLDASCRSPRSPARCVRSGSTTARPRCTAGRSPSGRYAPSPASTP